MYSKLTRISLLCTLIFASCADNPFGQIEEGDTGANRPPGTTDSGVTTDGADGGIGIGDDGMTDTGDVTGGGGGEPGGMEPGGMEPLGCGDFSDLSFDFDNNQLPPGFELVTNPTLVNGQLETNFPATPAGAVFTTTTHGIISSNEISINEGRLTAKISDIPSDSNSQGAIKLTFGTNVVGGVNRQIVAEVGRGPDGGFMATRDGVANNTMFFGDTGINWVGMRLDATTVYAETSVDGVTWETQSQAPRLGDTDAFVQLQGVNYDRSPNAVNIVFDDLNTNCPDE